MLLGLLFVLSLTACTKNLIQPNTELKTTDELKKFNTKQEIMDFLDTAQKYNSYNYYGYETFGNGIRAMALESGQADSASAALSAKSSDGASDFSTTNIQVEGVDEADFVKNDDKYIYVIAGNKLVIVDAYPADKAEILSKTDIDGYARELFVNGDKLVIFTDSNDEVYTFAQYDILPRPIYKQKTHAVVYDISDKEDPKVVKDYDVKGNYITSRMIGDYVYVVVQDYVYYYNRILDLPVVMESSKVVVSPEIYHFDMPETNYNFNTVMSLSLKDEDKVEAKTFMMGYSNVIYVSENNIYITYQKNLPYVYYERYNEQRFYDIIVPLLPSGVKNEINDIRKEDDLNEFEKWDKISAKLEEMYNDMEEDEKDELIEDMQKAITEYEIKREEEMRKTIIHKIKIDNGNLDYQGRGEVKGYLLNQFSMDENNDNLRVATIFETWSGQESVLYNNVYVLDENLKVIGEKEKIAPEERIYSTRFMGDRLYMVTFMRIDPFFVIDLSDPENPEVLGKLKIPGFSDYLHPYDENHIIGLGKETAENEWGGISTKGLKLALFDVSDVENPKMVDKYEIGEQGTDSEALNEHKAFLFDKEKNLLVIPVREVKGKQIYDSRYGYYRQRIWQGAYVLTITEEGFELKGKVSHNEADEESYWYWGSPNAVRRSLFMDDVLYTISNKKIMMNSLDDLDDINEIKLPYESYPYPYPMYKGGGVVGVETAVDGAVE